MFKSFITSIKNIFKWFPIIWDDRDYDYSYLLILLQKKLEFMKKTFESESKYIDNNNIILEIESVIEKLDRIIEDNYCESDWDELHNNLGKNSPIFNEDGSYYKIVFNGDAEYSNKVRELCDKEQNLRNKDIEYVFNTIKEKILGWWS